MHNLTIINIYKKYILKTLTHTHRFQNRYIFFVYANPFVQLRNTY